MAIADDDPRPDERLRDPAAGEPGSVGVFVKKSPFSALTPLTTMNRTMKKSGSSASTPAALQRRP